MPLEFMLKVLATKIGERKPPKVIAMIVALFMVMVSQVYIYLPTNQEVHFQKCERFFKKSKVISMHSYDGLRESISTKLQYISR